MTPKLYSQLAIGLLAVSIFIETASIAGLITLTTVPYHLIHLGLMTLLIAGQAALYFGYRAKLPEAKYAGLLGLGLASTAVGDFFNSELSPIDAVSLKLTWALLFFGMGYTLYVVALWGYLRTRDCTAFAGWQLIILPTIAVNVGVWVWLVYPHVADYPILAVGSFIFNATIYVALPSAARMIYNASGRSTAALVIVIGSLLIPISDLVLFPTWLPVDPEVTRELYASNWILYFGGQALFSLTSAYLIGRSKNEFA